MRVQVVGWGIFLAVCICVGVRVCVCVRVFLCTAYVLVCVRACVCVRVFLCTAYVLVCVRVCVHVHFYVRLAYVCVCACRWWNEALLYLYVCERERERAIKRARGIMVEKLWFGISKFTFWLRIEPNACTHTHKHTHTRVKA